MKFLKQLWDFIGSMRFAVSMLTIVAIASAIGTLLKQNEPHINYTNQFGDFWAKIFVHIGLDDVYNQSWFLGLLVFLLLSTSICLIRNTPKMLREMRSFKQHNRTRSLLHLPEHAQWHSDADGARLTARCAETFERLGYQVRAAQETVDGHTHIYFSAKRGRFNRLGYILTHLAIIVICLGGLMDSELSIRAQVWFFGKQPLTLPALQVPESATLKPDTLSYRGNISIPEGQTVDYVALYTDANHVLVQNLPFDITLNRFIVDYYSTGMPKRFASEVTVTDKDNGKQFQQTIEVNHPLRYKGVAVYQSSFGDGGSQFKLAIHPLRDAHLPVLRKDASMLDDQTLTIDNEKYQIEWRDFKPINVEDMREDHKQDNGFADALNPKGARKDFQNIGAMLNFVLRDSKGGATEYRNYMSPIMINGAAFFVSMQRNDLQNNFTNWHIPADADASIGDYMRIQKGIHDEAIVLQALNRLASARSLKPNERADYIKNAAAIMQLFREGGLIAISDKLGELPEIEQERMWQSVTGLIHTMTSHILNLQREQAQLAPRVDNEQTQRFIDDSINSYTKGTQYPAPFYLELESFTEIKSSELQVTRSPGQWWVYLGSLMLVLGTLAMAFIRERRVWLHITPDTTGNTLTLAMSSTRRTYDYRAHWQTLQARLQAVTSENP